MVFQYKFCRLINCWPFFKFCRLCCFFCRYHIACCLKMLIILFFVFLSEIFEELFVFSKCKLYLHYFGCCPLQWHYIVKSSFFEKIRVEMCFLVFHLTCYICSWLIVVVVITFTCITTVVGLLFVFNTIIFKFNWFFNNLRNEFDNLLYLLLTVAFLMLCPFFYCSKFL